ncbi:hypothetical protein E3Q05_02512 [Wallemia mellicola]|nr:hypothetical protein E3Q05_02512 [Wallemia mellicola]
MTYSKASKQLLNKDFVGCLDTISKSLKSANNNNVVNKLLSLELTCWLTLYLNGDNKSRYKQLNYTKPQFVDYLINLSRSRITATLPGRSQSALLLAIVRLEQLDKAKNEAEKWLFNASNADQDYNKVRDVYAFNILPEFGEWDVSREVLSSSAIDDNDQNNLLQRLADLEETASGEVLANTPETVTTEQSTPSLSRTSSTESSFTATPARVKTKEDNFETTPSAASTPLTSNGITPEQHSDIRSHISNHAKQPSLESVARNSNRPPTKTAKALNLLAKMREILPRVLPPFLIFLLAVLFASRRQNNANTARSIRERLAKRDGLWNKLLQTIQMGTRGMLP